MPALPKAKVLPFTLPEHPKAPPDAAAAPAPTRGGRHQAAPADGGAAPHWSLYGHPDFQLTGNNTARWCGYDIVYWKGEIWTWLDGEWWVIEGPRPKHVPWDDERHRWVSTHGMIKCLEEVQASSPPASSSGEGASAPPESTSGLAPPAPPPPPDGCAGGLEPRTHTTV